MYQRIGILGSRKLACQILDWMVLQNSGELIAGVAPHFKEPDGASFRTALRNNKIPVCDSLEDLIKLNPDILFSINYWKKLIKKSLTVFQAA